MDKKKPIVFLVLALVVGLLAALTVISRLSGGGGGKGKATGQEVNQIYVAKKDIPIGTRLTKESIASYLQKKSWPKDILPKDGIADEKELLDRIVKNPVVSETPILKQWLAGPGAAGVMPLVVELGMRAFTVTVDEASGVGGFLQPGARVDVIATFRNIRNSMSGARTAGTTLTKTILQDVRVLAVGQSMEQKEGQAKVVNSITLQVAPDQVETIALASREGQIALALRKLGDSSTDEEEPAGRTLDEMLGLPAVEPEPKVVAQAPRVETPEARTSIELIKGGQVTMVPVERR